MITQPLIKTRKHFIIAMTVYILFLSGLFITSANWGLTQGMTLKVQTYDRKLVNYKHQDLPNGNYFISGMQGDLYWRPKNLSEAILLDTVINGGIDFLDVIALAVIAVIISFMFRGQDDTILLPKNVTGWFLALVFALGLLGLISDDVRFQLADEYVPYITHGQFKAIYSFKVTSFYYMVYPMLMFLARLPKKALELQKEAELTI